MTVSLQEFIDFFWNRPTEIRRFRKVATLQKNYIYHASVNVYARAENKSIHVYV